LPSLGQGLRTVGFPLPLHGEKLHFIAARATWVLHIFLFHDNFQRLEHFCLNTAIACGCTGPRRMLYILDPEFISLVRAFQARPLLE